jgi:DNA-directed RNA polymerase subunit N (RpoN/RPB10)
MTNNNPNKLKLISEEVLNKYKSQIVYIQVRCTVCGRVHGINPNQETGEIKENQLRCFKCATEEYERYEDLIELARQEK